MEYQNNLNDKVNDVPLPLKKLQVMEFLSTRVSDTDKTSRKRLFSIILPKMIC